MHWLLACKKKADQDYAETVLQRLGEDEALAPNLWHLEAANVLLGAEKSGELELGEVERFIAQLECLPITVDALTSNQAFSRGLNLSRAYNLSSYDAAYLELALREGLPLATLDKNLIKAAKKPDIPLYLTE